MNTGPLVFSFSWEDHETLLTDQQKLIIQHPLVGGIVLFSANFENKEQLTNYIGEINSIAEQNHKNIIMMVDHEGGYVQRFKGDGFTTLPPAEVLGELYDQDPQSALNAAHLMGEITAYELKACGIDVILGPVVDLDNGNSAISKYGRAFHSDPIIVTEIAGAYIQGLEEGGLHGTLKHFPGHGEDIGDSHFTKPVDDRSLEEIQAQDLIPFEKLIDSGEVGGIMPAHITYPQVDPDHTAGTSTIWLQDILRDDLHFEGIIISDCLSMKGADSSDFSESILVTLQNADMAMLCNQDPDLYLALLDDLSETLPEQSVSPAKLEKWLGAEPQDGISYTQYTTDCAMLQQYLNIVEI